MVPGTSRYLNEGAEVLAVPCGMKAHVVMEVEASTHATQLPSYPATPLPRTSTTKAMVENLRREARVDARIKVTVVRGRRMISVETTDVSFKGLFLRTDDPPPLRSLMRLRVALPHREIEAHAMAVHVSTTDDPMDGRATGVGVQFWGLAGPDRVAWDDFVRELIQIKRAAVKRSLAANAADVSTSAGPSTSGVRLASAADLAVAPATKK